MPAVQASLLLNAGCSEDVAGPEPEVAEALLSVEPASGSVGVDAGTSVVVSFDHPVAAGMEAYAALHEGDPTGPGSRERG